MYEYLPVLLDEDMSEYTGYKPDLHPGISHVFQSAAFRFGHTLIPPGIYRRDESCNFRKTRTGQPAIRLCTTWWDSNVSECDDIKIVVIPSLLLFLPPPPLSLSVLIDNWY